MSRKSGAGRKPLLANSRIEWGDALSRGLVNYFLANELAGPTTRDLVSGRAPAWFVSGSAPTWRSDGIDIAGSQFLRVSPDGSPSSESDAPYIATTGLSIFWSGRIRTGSAFRHFAGKHDVAGTNNPFDFRTDDAATPSMALVRAHSVGPRVWSGPSVSLGVFHVVGFTVANNLIETAPTFYVDGVPTVGTLASGTESGAVSGATANLLIGRRTDGVVQMDGILRWLGIWSRALSGAEATRLTVDPYGFLVQPRRRSYSTGGEAQPPTVIRRGRPLALVLNY